MVKFSIYLACSRNETFFKVQEKYCRYLGVSIFMVNTLDSLTMFGTLYLGSGERVLFGGVTF